MGFKLRVFPEPGAPAITASEPLPVAARTAPNYSTYRTLRYPTRIPRRRSASSTPGRQRCWSMRGALRFFPSAIATSSSTSARPTQYRLSWSTGPSPAPGGTRMGSFGSTRSSPSFPGSVANLNGKRRRWRPSMPAEVLKLPSSLLRTRLSKLGTWQGPIGAEQAPSAPSRWRCHAARRPSYFPTGSTPPSRAIDRQTGSPASTELLRKT